MPRLLLTPEVNEMINLAARHTRSLEVGGFGHIREVNGNEDIIVDDIFIPPQTVQSAHTDIEVEGLDALMRHAASLNQTVDEWRLWWHSHSTMKAYASGTDESTLKGQAHWLGSWAVGLTVNVDGDRYCWLNTDAPFKLVLKDLPVGIYHPIVEDPSLKELVDSMMKDVKSRWGGYQGGYTPPKSPPSTPPPAPKQEVPETSTLTAEERRKLLQLELGDWFVEEKPGIWVPRYMLPVGDPRWRSKVFYDKEKADKEAQQRTPAPPAPPAQQAPMNGQQRPALPLPARQTGQTTPPTQSTIEDKTEDPEIQAIRARLEASRVSTSPDSDPASEQPSPESAPKRGRGRGRQSTTKLGNVGDARNARVVDADHELLPFIQPYDLDTNMPYILSDTRAPYNETLVFPDGTTFELSTVQSLDEIDDERVLAALKELDWTPSVFNPNDVANILGL